MKSRAKPLKLFNFWPLQHPWWLKIDRITDRKTNSGNIYSDKTVHHPPSSASPAHIHGKIPSQKTNDLIPVLKSSLTHHKVIITSLTPNWKHHNDTEGLSVFDSILYHWKIRLHFGFSHADTSLREVSA